MLLGVVYITSSLSGTAMHADPFLVDMNYMRVLRCVFDGANGYANDYING